MINTDKLVGAIHARGLSKGRYGELMGKNRSWVSRKLKEKNFTLAEADETVAVLSLSASEAMEIFFGQFVAEMRRKENQFFWRGGGNFLNGEKLKEKIKCRGMSFSQFHVLVKMKKTSFYRKLSGATDFTRGEIENIIKELNLY